MPNIDFYIVNEAPITACYRFACRLVDKAYQQKHQLYLHSNSMEEAKILDDLLWTFRDDGFIPHEILEKNIPPTVPVQLGFDVTPQHQQDILLSLTPTVPEFFAQFNRILEIVPNDEASRNTARKKFRFYRENNCQLKIHDLTKDAAIT